MLLIDVLRHGDAAPAGAGGDAARSLSPRGRSEVTRVARKLAQEPQRPARVFVSPLRRAQETAAIAIASLTPAPAVETLEALTPDTDPIELLSALAAHGGREGHVLLVTHQPLAGRLIDLLTGEEPACHPGTLARIACEDEAEPNRGRLVFLFHSR